MPRTVSRNRKINLRSKASKAQAVVTIGYQERTVIDFIRALRAAKVTTLVDIRAVPISRRAEFRKNALASLLDDAGIRYVGIPRLGTPKELRDRLKIDGNYGAFFRDFRAHMICQRAALRQLLDLSSSERVALLCFERVAAQCHRSVVAAYVSGKLSCDVIDI